MSASPAVLNVRSQQQDADARSLSFTWRGVRRGFLTSLPVALGVAGYGVVFGVLASEAGLSAAEAALMSATMLAGAAQLLAVELWRDPIPVVAVVTTVLVVNLRYLLLGASLRPWFSGLASREAYGSVFFMTDETWALTLADLRDAGGDAAFLVGSGAAVWLLWVASTVVGVLAGEAIGAPAQYGLDFVVTALFVTLAVGFWEGRESLRPWITAAAAALAANAVVPGQWYILAGAVAGAGVEVLFHDE